MKKLMFVLCACAGMALAQPKVMIAGAGGAAQNATFAFVSMESDAGQPVTGSPYSADIVTENKQTLADGTHISHKNSSKIYRDSQGRTRREQTFATVGPWAAEGKPAPNMITITDPVARETYILNGAEKTAQKMKMPESGSVGAFADASGAIGYMGAGHMGTATAGAGPESVHIEQITRRIKADDKSLQRDSLGRQTMEGLMVDGTRTTHTIPEGEIGNDRPITNTTEQWYSPDLQVTILRKTTDPQMGENIYRVTNISRVEPSADLFQVPADYKVQEGGPMPVKSIRIIQRQAAPAEK